jgi:hypothetical protein
MRAGVLCSDLGKSFICNAHDKGGFAVVAGIQDASQFVVPLQKRVCFIDQQRGPRFLNDAKECGANVCRSDRPIDQPSEKCEQCRFAATLFWRFDSEIRADIAQLECVGVEYPERQRFGRAFGEHDKPPDGGSEFIEEQFAIGWS